MCRTGIAGVGEEEATEEEEEAVGVAVERGEGIGEKADGKKATENENGGMIEGTMAGMIAGTMADLTGGTMADMIEGTTGGMITETIGGMIGETTGVMTKEIKETTKAAGENNVGISLVPM